MHCWTHCTPDHAQAHGHWHRVSPSSRRYEKAVISREHCQHDLADHDQARLFFHPLDHPRTKILAAKAIVEVGMILTANETLVVIRAGWDGFRLRHHRSSAYRVSILHLPARRPVRVDLYCDARSFRESSSCAQSVRRNLSNEICQTKPKYQVEDNNTPSQQATGILAKLIMCERWNFDGADSWEVVSTQCDFCPLL